MKAIPPSIHCLREDLGSHKTEIFVLCKKSETFQILYQVNKVTPVPERVNQGWIDSQQDSTRHSVPKETYWSILDKVSTFDLKISPPFQSGFDGDIYRLWLRNGYCETQFCWWCDCPPQWQVLETIVNEIVSLVNK